jgi:HEAT repeat protein
MKATRLRILSAFATGALLVVGAIVAAPSARADEAALRSALDDYAAGKYEEALTKLREYVATNPGSDEVYAVLRSADDRVLRSTLARGGEHERLMRYVMDRARPTVEQKKRDPEGIAKLAESALSGPLDVRRRAAIELAARYGEYAVPTLLGAFLSGDAEKVWNAMHTLHLIGADAVLALNAAADSPDARMRTYVFSTLGDIRDERALPVLRRAAERDADEGARAKAQAALQKIRPNSPPVAAVDSYVRTGELYLSDDPSVMSSGDEVANVWRWEGEGLARVEVPHGLLNEELAHDSAWDALELDPAHLGARSLLVRARLAGLVEGRALGEKAPAGLKAAPDVLASQGFDAASAALADALSRRDWDVAVEAIRLVAATYGRQDLRGHPIGAALVSSERRVQYAAAIAALRMSPGGPFENSMQVPALAAQAASETALRQVFVLDDRDDMRNRLTQALRENGYVVADDADGYRGVSRIKSAPTVDVVVVRGDLGAAGQIPSARWRSTLAVIDELLADARTKNMRIVVVTGPDGAATESTKKLLSEKYGEKIAEYVAEPLEAAVVMPKIEAVVAGADVNRERALAVATAADAADAFATTNAHCTAWDFRVAIDPLGNNALEGASDEVRMNAVRALGNLRAGGSAPLAEILKSAEAKEELKVAAAKALGEVLSAVPPTGDEVDTLLATAKAGGVVGAQALRALGMVRGLTPEQARQVWGEHKIDVGSGSGEGGEAPASE